MSSSTPSAPQIPGLPGQASGGLALFEQFNRALNILQGLQTEQAGFTEREVTKEVDPKDVSGITQADRRTLREVLNTRKRIQAGETEFVDPQGRQVKVDPDAGTISFGDITLSLEEQEEAERALVNSILDRGTEDVRFDPATGTLTQLATELEPTEERLQQEKEFKELQEISTRIQKQQLEAIEEAAKQADSPAAKAALERQRELQRQQQEILQQRIERQEAALKGEIEPSDALKQAREEAVNTIKESAARRGITIEGDTLEGLTSESSAGIQMIRQLQQRFDVAAQQERQSIIAGETPLFQQGLGQSGVFALQPFQRGLTGQPGISPFVASQPGAAGALPQLTSGFGQAGNLFGQALSPFMQQNALLASQQQFQGPSQGSQLLGAGIGALGMIGGGLTANPLLFAGGAAQTANAFSGGVAPRQF